LEVDWSKLPDLIAVGLLAWAFASVVRSCRTVASRNWLLGWYFIVLHFAAAFFGAFPGLIGQVMAVISIMGLIMAALLFMRSSVVDFIQLERATKIVMPIISGCFLLLVCVLVFGGPRWLLNTSEALVGFTPLFMSLVFPRWSIPLLRWSMTIVHCALWVFLWQTRNLPNAGDLALNGILFTVYFGCAVHFWYHNRKATTGAMIGIVGFWLWAGVFVLAPMLSAFLPDYKVEPEIWNLPKYIVAVGMILLMLEQQIEHNKHLALHDELTGLPNRRLFQDRLAGAIERARRTGTQAALLTVDLDDFKLVNDTYGHHTGDMLLQRIARLFNGRIRHSDTVARTGGDEFAVILEPPTTQEEAALVSRSLLDLLQEPMRLNENTVHIGASVGIAIFPDDAKDLKSLCIQADMRMYETKRGITFDTGSAPRKLPADALPGITTARAS
jgi:diguanylate cyclase (GGDEF)-like protein